MQSLIAQSERHIEILLIDDGSTDGSGAICDHYAAQDSRMRVTHKANGGVSSARNLALELATGAYVVFVDADDYVAPAFVQRMGDRMVDHDVVVCAYNRVRADSAQPFVLCGSGALALDALYEHTLCTLLIGGGCCNKAFRMDTIRKHALRFDTRIAVGEDLLFLVQYYQHCRTAYYIGDTLYHYRYNEVSATESAFAQKKVHQGSASILMALDEMEHHIDRTVPFQVAFLGYRKVRSSLRLFFQMVLSRTWNTQWLVAIKRNIRQSFGVFVSSTHARWLERAAAGGIFFSVRLAYAGAVLMSMLLGNRMARLRN
ncbi:glycosyltransferase [Hydrogenophaga sp. PAMC20947]|uniref:glycosyltransferase family 2 protein n=1 Tax=Hydrogenophaga sp. PAMC20947 TaxID=2565558 RepID=UPI001FF9EE6D|nr:glycosyltransferase [Hydrogenophaga sp. PAMC20947]